MAYKETQKGLRRHLLLTAEIKAELPLLYSTETIPTNQKMVAVKFFSPYSDFTWYITEGDPIGSDGEVLTRGREDLAVDWRFFGYVTRNDSSMSEWGYSSLRELEEAKVYGNVPAVERDCHWTPRSNSEGDLMRGSIRLSDKHGVNPSLDICFFCGEATGVALLGRLRDDEEAPREAVYSYEPCKACTEMMATGFTLVEAATLPYKEGQPPISTVDGTDVYPSGAWVVMKTEAALRIFDETVVGHVRAFVEPEVMARIQAAIEG